MNKEAIKVFSLMLAIVSTHWVWGCATSSADSEAERADVNMVKVVLEGLKRRTSKLKSYQAEVEYRFIQPLLESETLRKGVLYYKSSDGKSALRMNFQTLKQDDGEQQEYIEQYIFDGIWLTHIDYQIKEVKCYQKAEPDKPVDAFEWVGKNFPIIGFSKVQELEKEFEIKLIEQQADDIVQLHLKVKPNSVYKDSYTFIDFWIDKKLYLPAQIAAVSVEEDIYKIKFLTPKVNKKMDDKVFEIKIPEGFGVETVLLEEKQK